jgi:hypothetical protein
MPDSFWVSGLFHRWRKTKSKPAGSQTDFSALLRIFRQDGWVYLELLLINRSEVTVWVEHATIVLSELEANSQTSICTGQAKHAILQNIGLDDTLRVGLAGAIYDAAGRPQGKYSSLVITTVRYRVGDFNQTLDVYRVEMGALIRSGNKIGSGQVPGFPDANERLEDVAWSDLLVGRCVTQSLLM